MKRFWKAVAVVPVDGGFSIQLDGRPVRTPARALLVLPHAALATEVAAEWGAVEGKIDPRAMPLTGLANAAIDQVGPHKDAFASGLARYAEADLACYRAEGPQLLAERQAQSWDALLAWGRRRFDIDFAATCGIVHVAQPAPTVERLAQRIAVLDPLRLAALSPLVTIGGSLLAALALLEGAYSTQLAWDTVTIDDRWQLEKWGLDAEAVAALENRRQDFFAAAKFLELLDA